jgi:hypothetical protein
MFRGKSGARKLKAIAICKKGESVNINKLRLTRKKGESISVNS